MGERSETEISNVSFWKCAGLSQKLYHWGQTMSLSGLVLYPSLMLGVLGYPMLRLSSIPVWSWFIALEPPQPWGCAPGLYPRVLSWCFLGFTSNFLLSRAPFSPEPELNLISLLCRASSWIARARWSVELCGFWKVHFRMGLEGEILNELKTNISLNCWGSGLSHRAVLCNTGIFFPVLLIFLSVLEYFHAI